MEQAILDTLHQLLTIARRSDSPWLSSREGAAYVRMSQTEFSKAIASGEIPSHRRGKTIFVSKRDLDEWMESQPSGANPITQALRSV